ncbi:hypothetical protein AVEN_219917-1 [Araneus ventricosus]|uniref:Uncharacterized protein n=1 Tax=Araneus ventricosus TaxID=182803 RepID=A0A4Y2HJI3_ARAVE|nr:hypothetical protein AVEN_219917-1 [Araneus ventricosus]
MDFFNARPVALRVSPVWSLHHCTLCKRFADFFPTPALSTEIITFSLMYLCCKALLRLLPTPALCSTEIITCLVRLHCTCAKRFLTSFHARLTALGGSSPWSALVP